MLRQKVRGSVLGLPRRGPLLSNSLLYGDNYLAVLVTFTHIGYEQYGLSYLDLWTLPALWSRSRAQRIRMAFSDITERALKE